MQQYNPHQDASNAYSHNRAAGLSDPRTLEAQILLKAAAKLDFLRTRLEKGEMLSVTDVGEPLEYNKKLWVVFADSMGDDAHELPQDLKNNIASLSIFMMKQTLDIMADPKPDKLETMININRQIASGLMKQAEKQPSSSAETMREDDFLANTSDRGESIEA